MMFNAWAKSPNGIHQAISLFCETQLAEFDRNDIHVCMYNEIIAFEIKYRKSFFYQKKYVKWNQYNQKKENVWCSATQILEKKKQKSIHSTSIIYSLFVLSNIYLRGQPQPIIMLVIVEPMLAKPKVQFDKHLLWYYCRMNECALALLQHKVTKTELQNSQIFLFCLIYWLEIECFWVCNIVLYACCVSIHLFCISSAA